MKKNLLYHLTFCFIVTLSLQLNAQNWTQTGSTKYGPYIYSKYGHAVASNNDGTHIIVSAPQASTAGGLKPGRYVDILQWNASTNDWDTEATINYDDVGESSSSDGFGYDLDMSDDGNRVIILSSTQKKVYVLSRSTGGVWSYDNTISFSASNNYAKASISGDGNYIAIRYATYAKVYSYNGTQREGNIVVSSGNYDIDLNNDGSRLVVGDVYNSDEHRVRVYYWNSSNYSQLGSDIRNYDSNSDFGRSIQLDALGNRMIVGAPNDYSAQGKAYVYQYGSSWTNIYTINLGYPYYYSLGTSVSISNDGNRIATVSKGSWGSVNGYIYVYENTSGSTWAQVGQQLSFPNYYEPGSIDLSGDGEQMVLGCPGYNPTFDYDRGLMQTFGPVTPPTVSTTAASSITANSAILGGNVTNNGGAIVTERGVVYSSTDATPTIEEGATKDANGSGTGSFSESISLLTASTTYYVRAYATNSAGTSYGAPVSFNTSSCTNPTIPTVTSTPTTVCSGNTATLNVSGTLNDATQWAIYTGSCGGTLLGTTATSSFDVSPGSSTTYYVRGEGGCVTPGSCGTVTVNTTPLEDASFSYSAAAYCANDSDPTPTITGLTGGTFSSTAGLAINASTGAIDVSASTPGTYTVTYTTAGLCFGSENVLVTINAVDDASFNYSAASYCSNESDPTPTISGLAGGTFSSTAGLSISATTGTIDVSASTPGTYAVTYTTAGTCPTSSNVSVTVNSSPIVTFTAPGDVCPESAVLTAQGGGLPVGGVYSGSGVTDDGNGTTYSFNPAAAGVGVHTITYTFSDGNGCSGSASDKIEVGDTTSPTAVCQNITAYLDGSGNIAIAAADIDGGSTDNCSSVTLGSSKTAYTCADLGANNVTLTVTDGSSNTDQCTAIVTVIDTTSPTAVCQNINAYLDGTGTAIVFSNDVDGGSTDNCSISGLSSSPAIFTCSNLGANNVTLTVTDGSSYTDQCTATVTVLDTTPPTPDVATLPNLTAQCQVTSLTPPTATDNCGGTVIVTNNATLPITGTTVITWAYNDGNGNITFQNQNIIIDDTTPPIAVCQDISVYLDTDGLASIDSSFIDSLSSDACGITTMTLSVTDFDCSDVGANPVVMTVFDNHGNSSTCSSVVTVLDTIAPVVLCQDTIISLDTDGKATIDTSFVYKGSTDACGVADVWLSKTNFNGSNAGGNAVIVSVSDVNGNTGTCTAIVTIMDTIAPEARCQDIGITLDTADRARIYPGFIDNGSTDEGGIVSYTLDKTRFYCSDIGENTVVMSVKDVGGNVSTCSAIVTVADNWLPEVACNDIEVSLGATGVAVIDSSMITDAASAICGIATIEVSHSEFTSADLGDNTVTLTATNLSGVSSTCESTVTVKDEIYPTAKCHPISIWLSNDGGYTLSDNDIAMVADSSSDNASVFDSLQVVIAPATFDCSDVGDSVAVAVSISDEAGNESTCDTWVYVRDSMELFPATFDDVEVSLPSGSCDSLTVIDYPEMHVTSCATLTQLEGLGADGLFPIGTTGETWELDYNSVKDTFSFAVIVSTENALPTIDTLTNVTASEDDIPVSIPLSGITGGNDCTAQDVTVSAGNTNGTLVTALDVDYTPGDTAGVLTLTLAANQSGTDSITVTVEDSEGGKSSTTFRLMVAPINDAPVLLTKLEDIELAAEDSVEYTVSTLLGVVFDDIDDSVLVYTARLADTTLPGWMNISQTAEMLSAELTPIAADTGCYTLIIEATDLTGVMVADTLEVCVLPPKVVVGIGEMEMNAFDVEMYPSPSKGSVNLGLSRGFEGEAKLRVMNIVGQTVLQQTYRSTQHIEFDLSENVSGMYIVILQVEGKRVVKKLILDRK